ncbi:MAG: DUF3277 family protein [Sweet potato little leaf phytoplasma]|nr:DUF3277 family protein [Sweet potato little leaf phytoplasma]
MATTQRSGTYRPKDLSIVISNETLGISHIVGGFSEDAIVNIERGADGFALYVGSDNFTTRVENANDSGNVTITLQQSSPSNDFLQALYNGDRGSRNDDYVCSILIKDNSGRTMFFSDEAWVGMQANANFSNSLQTREWVFQCAHLQSYVGGNARVTATDRDLLADLGVTLEDRWV